MDEARPARERPGERDRRGTYVAVVVVEAVVILGLWLFSRHFGG